MNLEARLEREAMSRLVGREKELKWVWIFLCVLVLGTTACVFDLMYQGKRIDTLNKKVSALEVVLLSLSGIPCPEETSLLQDPVFLRNLTNTSINLMKSVDSLSDRLGGCEKHGRP